MYLTQHVICCVYLLNLSSQQSYHVLNSGDLALYHSHEGDMIGTFRCIAISGNSSVILANYTVVEGRYNSTAFVGCMLLIMVTDQCR